MKKFLLPSLAVFLLTSAGALAQSTEQKVETKTEEAVAATETTVKKDAKKTGAAVEKAADATADGVKTEAKKTEDAAKTAADATGKAAKKAAKDVADSEIYKKIETELGKPFTPEQKAKYAEAWQAAQDKARAAEKEFSDKVSEITGVGKKKTTKIVKDSGL